MPIKTDLPRRIVGLLKQKPTATRREISQELGVSYQAVQKHLQRLQDDEMVRPGFLVSEGWEAGKHEFWISIATRFDQAGGDGDYQTRLCREITVELTEGGEYAEDISFGSVRILLGGDWDIVLRVFSRDPDVVGRFVTRYLRTQASIVRTSTAWSLGEPGESGPPEGAKHP